MVIIGLILNFLGSILLINATTWVKYDKDLGLTVSETKKKLCILGVVLLCLGFLLQLIERIAPLFIR